MCVCVCVSAHTYVYEGGATLSTGKMQLARQISIEAACIQFLRMPLGKE